uniref:Uncharacterized protein n=1 Tax=Streptomyces pratensis (strain ATCC 33331 / IAF-45CD) TaxID=591167 RepID=A0A8D4BEH7_STRFA
MPWVRLYVRRDGTKVQGHSRWAAGGRREMSTVVMVGLAVVVLGNPANSDSGSGATPRPAPTAVYPVTFPKTERTSSTPRPQPTVSYPIRFPQASKAAARPRPRSTVTYPIPWDRSAR